MKVHGAKPPVLEHLKLLVGRRTSPASSEQALVHEDAVTRLQRDVG